MTEKNGKCGDTIVFVTTIGDDANFSECMERLRAQTISCPVEVIERVAPMSAALQEMHERCRAPHYVQVDEDMLLFPHALATLRELISAAPPDVALVCAPLWDCDTGMPIAGVKIYRHEIVRRFPYRNKVSCEVDQVERLRLAGYRIERLPLNGRSTCLGEHGKHYRPRTIFRRWQRLFQKKHFRANLDWVDPWPRRLLERYCETGSEEHLYAFLGAVAGIAGGRPLDKELDYRDPNEAFDRLRKYFPTTEL